MSISTSIFSEVMLQLPQFSKCLLQPTVRLKTSQSSNKPDKVLPILSQMLANLQNGQKIYNVSVNIEALSLSEFSATFLHMVLLLLEIYASLTSSAPALS